MWINYFIKQKIFSINCLLRALFLKILKDIVLIMTKNNLPAENNIHKIMRLYF